MSHTGNKYLVIGVPPQEYDPVEAGSFRYTLSQNFQDVGTDVKVALEHSDKTASLSLRRFQFLLMGASNG